MTLPSQARALAERLIEWAEDTIDGEYLNRPSLRDDLEQAAALLRGEPNTEQAVRDVIVHARASNDIIVGLGACAEMLAEDGYTYSAKVCEAAAALLREPEPTWSREQVAAEIAARMESPARFFASAETERAFQETARAYSESCLDRRCRICGGESSHVRAAAPQPLDRETPEDELLRRFVDVMHEKLVENAHKSSWRGMAPRDLLRRLREETVELTAALRTFEEDGDPFAVTREAADVANYAAMVADVVDRHAILARLEGRDSK